MKPLVFSSWMALILIPFFSQAQINDCVDALVVCDNGDLGFNPQGPGINDFADPDNIPGCLTALEQNSAWYYFQIDPAAPPNLVLGFIISPNGGFGEDYDWALFGPNVNCGDLGAPIRCSSSSAMCGFCPETGMGMGALDVSEGPGTGDGFVMTLIVQPGQGFYLLIDNWLGTPNGFVLTWTDSASDYLNCNASPPCALNAVAGPNIQACEGDEDIPLNGSSTGNNGNEMYSWSGTNGGTNFLSDPNVQDPTVTLPPGFTGTITYTLTVVEDTCVGEDQLDLIVNPLPNINITQIGPFCANALPQALSATPFGGTWGGAATGNTFNPMTNGPGFHTVTYTYTDNNNCSKTESIDIEVFDLPDVVIDPDPAEFCDSENSILLTATGSNGAGGYTFNWSTPSGPGVDNTYDAELDGQYFVTVTDDNGCSNTTVSTVTSYANPTVQILDPGPLCESDDFFSMNAIPPGGYWDGSIININGDISPSMHPPGTYLISYTYTDNNECDGTDYFNVTIIPKPEAIAENNGPLCEGEPILLTGETTAMGFVITYEWEGPNGYVSTVQNPTDATEAGDYILVITVDNCPSDPAVTTVILTPKPEAFASNSGPYCNGQSIQLYGTTNTPGTNTTYAWLGPNGYTSDIQNPGDAIDEGIYTLIISVDNCASDSTTTEVIFSTPPNAQSSNDGPYCTGDSITLFGTTTTPGNTILYNWTGPNGYTSTAQNPGTATSGGLYELIITVDGCSSPAIPTTVIVNTAPQPVITGQDTFCTGFSSVMDAGTGYAGYLWSDASTNQTLEVFTTGTYQITVTNANGCTGEASFSVTETAALMPTISGTLGFCEGSGTMLDAGAGYTNYVWSTGASGQTISVANGGNFGVIVTDTDGCTGSANVTTTEYVLPTVTIGGSTTYCIGNFTILDAGAGYTNYTWSNGSMTQTIIVSSPGIYGVDVIDVNGCPGSDMVNVQESTSLMPVITGGDAFCEGGSLTLNAGSGFATYQWSDGSSNQNLPVAVAGVYEVSVTDGSGCSGTSSVMVIEVAPPAAVVQPTIELCNTTAGGSVINLYDLVLSGDMTGTWQDMDMSGAVGLFTNLNFNLIPAGNYRFQYTTNAAIAPCPETSYVVNVTVLDCSCPDVIFVTAPPLCNAGGMVDMSTIITTTEPGVWSIIQTPPGSSPAVLAGTLFNATNGDPGSYTLQFALQNQPPPGCPLDYQATVEVDPSVDAGVALPPVAFCFGETDIIQLTGLLSGADTGGSWTETSSVGSQGNAFSALNASFDITGQLANTYTFDYTLISNGACPDDGEQVTVIIHPVPVISIQNPDELNCTNTTLILDATGSSTGSSYDITWTGPGVVADGNEKTLRPTVNKPGVYLLTITNTTTNCTQFASVTVLQNTDAPRTAIIQAKAPSCFGDTDGFIGIDQVIGGVPPFLYSLNNAAFDTDDLFTQLPPGDYTLSLEDANGCRWDTVITLAAPQDFSVSLGQDVEILFGESATIQAILTPPSLEIDTLIWTPDDVVECFDMDCLEGTVLTYNSINLTATVYDTNGCVASDQVALLVRVIRNVYIPNSFSPNGDGVNDEFYPFGNASQITRIKKFQVYDRWGSLMYEATDFMPNDASKGWNGLFRGEELNAGVFVYHAEVEYVDGLTEVLSGDVTLVK